MMTNNDISFWKFFALKYCNFATILSLNTWWNMAVAGRKGRWREVLSYGFNFFKYKHKTIYFLIYIPVNIKLSFSTNPWFVSKFPI